MFNKFGNISNTVISGGGTTIVNGRRITVPPGGTMSIVNGILFINGRRVDENDPDVRVEGDPKMAITQVVIQGDVDKLSVDNGDVTVKGAAGAVKVGRGDVRCGACGPINTASGDIKVSGDVNGDVNTGNGSIKVTGAVSGKCATANGDIRHG